MKFIPILFSADMVNAIKDGTKTQTRRVVKSPAMQQHPNNATGQDEGGFYFKLGNDKFHQLKPKAKKGDVFWVRENWATGPVDDKIKPSLLPAETPIVYIADYSKAEYKGFPKVRPSIFMPKWACRLFLEVVDVRIERLQDISGRDAQLEGVLTKEVGITKISNRNQVFYFNYVTGEYSFFFPRTSFISLWQSINEKKYPWDSNPHVWVYEFKVIDKPENFK